MQLCPICNHAPTTALLAPRIVVTLPPAGPCGNPGAPGRSPGAPIARSARSVPRTKVDARGPSPSSWPIASAAPNHFGGLTREESATALGVTERVVKRDLVVAQAWLRRELAEPGA